MSASMRLCKGEQAGGFTTMSHNVTEQGTKGVNFPLSCIEPAVDSTGSQGAQTFHGEGVWDLQ